MNNSLGGHSQLSGHQYGGALDDLTHEQILEYLADIEKQNDPHGGGGDDLALYSMKIE